MTVIETQVTDLVGRVEQLEKAPPPADAPAYAPYASCSVKTLVQNTEHALRADYSHDGTKLAVARYGYG